MFDIGFPELIIVSIVALLVIGPEKLPDTIRTIALWLGRIRRSLANIKQELEQEIGADDIRQQLHNESIMKDIDAAKRDLEGVINNTNESLNEIKNASRIDPDKPITAVTKDTQEDDGRKHAGG